MEKFCDALVYDYLVTVCANLAKVFKAKRKVPDLCSGSPKLVDVIRTYQEFGNKKVDVKFATGSSDESSDSDSSSDNNKSTSVSNKNKNGTNMLSVQKVNKPMMSTKTLMKATSSEGDSSLSEDEPVKAVAVSQKPSSIINTATSSDDSSSDEVEKSKAAILPTKLTVPSKNPSKSVIQQSTSSDDSSSEEEEPITKKKVNATKDSSSEGSCSSDDKPTTKKTIIDKVASEKTQLSSDDDSSSEEDQPAKNIVSFQKSGAIMKETIIQSTTSEDSSSDEDQPSNRRVTPNANVGKSTAKNIGYTPGLTASKSESSSDESSDSSEKPALLSSAKKRKLTCNNGMGPSKIPKITSKESSEDSSDDSSEEETVKPLVHKTVLVKKLKSDSDESSSESNSEDESPAKIAAPVEVKKKPTYHNFVKAGDNQSPSTPKIAGHHLAKKMNGKAQTSAGNTPFRRVREDEIEVDERVKNNSFEAKKNARGSYGEKANNDLKNTRGKHFKHEKTKKKRGNYRGGLIDMGVNSIKFSD